MKRVISIFLLALLLISGQTPAQAQGDDPTWKPGRYIGWIKLTLYLGKEHKVAEGPVDYQQDTVVYWQGRGRLFITVSPDGTGQVGFHIPLQVTGQETGYVNTPQGSCSFTFGGLGHMLLQSSIPQDPERIDLRFNGKANPVGEDEVQAWVKSIQTQGGAMCKPLAATQLFLDETIKNTSAGFMKELEFGTFETLGQTSTSRNGSCAVVDWDKKIPVPNGKGERVSKWCEWRVYRVKGAK